MRRYVALDTETTGLDLSTDRMVEVGCVEIISNILTGNHFHSYLNPEQPNSSGASAIHGLSDAFLREQPTFAEMLGSFLTFVSGARLIVHNAVFDINFLDRELASLGQPSVVRFSEGVVDTYLRAKALFAGRRNSLDALCDRLKIPRGERLRHGALLDAKLLAQLFLGIKDPRIPLKKRYNPVQVLVPEREGGDVLSSVVASAEEATSHSKILQDIVNLTAGNCLLECW